MIHRGKCEGKGARMGQSDLEMQPLQHGEGQEKRNYWDNVFRTLAEADGDTSELQVKGDTVDHARYGGVPTIHIRKLKKYLREQESLQVNNTLKINKYSTKGI